MPWRKAIEQFYASYREARFQDVQTIFTRFFLQLHPDWSPAQIKSALSNRADLLIKDAIIGTHDVGPTAQGAGRENLSVSANATTWMDPVSASFGKINGRQPTALNVTLWNPTSSAQTFNVSVTKFTPDDFGGTVDLIYDAGILSAGDDRISVPTRVTVTCRTGFNTMRVGVAQGFRRTLLFRVG